MTWGLQIAGLLLAFLIFASLFDHDDDDLRPA